MALNLTDKFIDEIVELSNYEFSTSVFQTAKNFLLDYLGVTFAGAQITKKKGNHLMEKFQSEGNCSAIGFDKKLSPQTAIFINGLSSHVAELDDGVISGSVHPGAPLFSALLAVSESQQISARQFLVGTIVGYEVIIRLANAIQPGHKQKGYHATGTCGAIGSAVAIAVMLGLPKEKIKNAFSSAIIAASGTLKAIEDNSELKPLNVANAALNAYNSSMMACVNFQGPEDPLSGRRGFFSVMCCDYDESQLFDDSFNNLKINNTYIKPYAACRYCHPAIDAVFLLRKKHEIDIDNIKKISVETYNLAVFNHDHTSIESLSSAKMSIPFSVAVALKNGKAGIEEFSTFSITDQELSRLTKKVSVNSNDSFTKNFPMKSQSSLEIVTNDGKKYYEKVDFPKGEPENPLSAVELNEKFSELCEFAKKSRQDSENIISIVSNLENRFNELYPLL